MDADIKLFLSIVVMVVVVFTLINVFRKQGKSSKSGLFQQTVIDGQKHDQSTMMPKYDQDPLFDDINIPKTSNEPPIKDSAPVQAASDIVSIFILPRNRNGFSGRALSSALHSNKFYYGKHQIFHRHQDDDMHLPILFSAASLTEPGYFDEMLMHKTAYKGIVLFLRVSELDNPLYIFDSMLSSARKLAVGLNAELCDSGRSHLTSQTISHLRENISEAHRRKLTQRG